MKQVPFIVKENFLSDDEFRLVAQESERLMRYLRDGKFSRPAKTEDGKLVPMDVKVGDKVLFGKWSGTEVKIDGKEYSIMKESDIMGISSK